MAELVFEPSSVAPESACFTTVQVEMRQEGDGPVLNIGNAPGLALGIL